MTPQQIELGQTSFKKAVPIAGIAVDLFYNRHFEIEPDVRPMFPSDMAVRKVTLISMLGTAVTSLHKLDEILPAGKVAWMETYAALAGVMRLLADRTGRPPKLLQRGLIDALEEHRIPVGHVPCGRTAHNHIS